MTLKLCEHLWKTKFVHKGQGTIQEQCSTSVPQRDSHHFKDSQGDLSNSIRFYTT